MLTRWIARSEVVAEAATEYNTGVEYEYEYRVAEYEYDEVRKSGSQEVRKSEPGRAPKDGYRSPNSCQLADSEFVCICLRCSVQR
ncbi:hypothetical protein Q31b_25780 [Novipirellula aureliae]|uniref:Uncharacterized protein n=1 Tax=Novipirellula aureliae TaxID=2527966 RepID=A0A5C6E6F1_9BACT|nr:hypothetical protein [Novipirellula aureliae]TWU43537.1 hypothetical protein Q31b_25780 [Novipirellula aureliae]